MLSRGRFSFGCWSSMFSKYSNKGFRPPKSIRRPIRRLGHFFVRLVRFPHKSEYVRER
jgi:hypothetical protein